jgi:hypothetical protein
LIGSGGLGLGLLDRVSREEEEEKKDGLVFSDASHNRAFLDLKMEVG